jgi:hypothetical protein
MPVRPNAYARAGSEDRRLMATCATGRAGNRELALVTRHARHELLAAVCWPPADTKAAREDFSEDGAVFETLPAKNGGPVRVVNKSTAQPRRARSAARPGGNVSFAQSRVPADIVSGAQGAALGISRHCCAASWEPASAALRCVEVPGRGHLRRLRRAPAAGRWLPPARSDGSPRDYLASLAGCQALRRVRHPGNLVFTWQLP